MVDNQEYKCNCGWIGTEEKMMADYNHDGGHCNTCCPDCGAWYSLDMYQKVNDLYLFITSK